MNEWLSKRYTYLLGVVDWKAVYLWHTLWFIVLQEESRIIGCIFFHGEPNAKLEIEIGEYLWENYREKGYGTETLQKFIEYAFNETEVKTILWRILKSNPCRLASQRMVEKMGMVNSHETDTAFLYKLTKHRNSTSVVEKMEHC
jgi:RimJ/RimL family protein N-acetyltransferase